MGSPCPHRSTPIATSPKQEAHELCCAELRCAALWLLQSSVALARVRLVGGKLHCVCEMKQSSPFCPIFDLQPDVEAYSSSHPERKGSSTGLFLTPTFQAMIDISQFFLAHSPTPPSICWAQMPSPEWFNTELQCTHRSGNIHQPNAPHHTSCSACACACAHARARWCWCL